MEIYFGVKKIFRVVFILSSQKITDYVLRQAPSKLQKIVKKFVHTSSKKSIIVWLFMAKKVVSSVIFFALIIPIALPSLSTKGEPL